MLPLLFNLKLVLTILFVLNLLSVWLFKGEYRFVKGQLMFFALLVAAFLGYRLLVFPAVKKQVEQERNAEIKNQGWEYINQPEVDTAFKKREIENQQLNLALFKIAGLQAVFAFIFTLIGIFISTEKKLYAVYALGFFVVACLFLI